MTVCFYCAIQKKLIIDKTIKKKMINKCDDKPDKTKNKQKHILNGGFFFSSN